MSPSARQTWGLVTVLQRPGGVPACLMGRGQLGAGPMLPDGRCDLDLSGSGPWPGPHCSLSGQGGTVPECGQEVAASRARRAVGPACPCAP